MLELVRVMVGGVSQGSELSKTGQRLLEVVHW